MSLRYPSDSKCDELSVKDIISKYFTHPSIEKVKEDFSLQKEFVLPPASISKIKKLLNL